MKNKTVTLSREQAIALAYADASNGASAMQLMDGWRVMAELRAALAEPVPPAGGEVEVLGYRWKTWQDGEPKVGSYVMSNGSEPEFVQQLVDRAHIIRLQAEVRLLKHDVASYLETAAKTCDLLGIDLEAAKTAEGKPSDVLYRHAMALQAELTKARELLRANAADFEGIRRALAAFHKANAEQWCGYLDDSLGICLFRIKELAAFLAHQSAPAAKGGDPSCNNEREDCGLPTDHECRACGRGPCIDR